MKIADLQATIQALTSEEMSNIWHYYKLVNDMKMAAPPIWKKRYKGHTQRACRLFFVSWLCGREITTFKDLTEKELYFIDRWFYGLLGNGYEQGENHILNVQQYAVYCRQHAEQIRELAETIKERAQK